MAAENKEECHIGKDYCITIKNEKKSDERVILFTEEMCQQGGSKSIIFESTCIEGKGQDEDQDEGGERIISFNANYGMRARWGGKSKINNKNFSLDKTSKSKLIKLDPMNIEKNGAELIFDAQKVLFKPSKSANVQVGEGNIGIKCGKWDENIVEKYNPMLCLTQDGKEIEAVKAISTATTKFVLTPKIKICLSYQKVGDAVSVFSKTDASTIEFKGGKNNAVCTITSDNTITVTLSK